MFGIVLQTISYMAERVVGQGSFGIVFQVMFQYKSLCFNQLLLLALVTEKYAVLE